VGGKFPTCRPVQCGQRRLPAKWNAYYAFCGQTAGEISYTPVGAFEARNRVDVWYPRIPTSRLRVMAGVTLSATLLAGLYGSLHDQVSYSISPEYFERMKFHQFRYADFGLPPRLFAAEIGFLATWWVGLIAGWLLARMGLAELWAASGRALIVRAFALMLGVAACTGAAAALLGSVVASGET